MPNIFARERNYGTSYEVRVHIEGRVIVKTFRNRADAETFADQHGGWGRGKPGFPPRPLDERLWENIDRRGTEECWPWTGATNPKGYGRFYAGRRADGSERNAFVHRLVWESENRTTIPDGLVIRHKCDNPPCCNPSHLEIGTPQDNTDDMMKRRGHFMTKRTHCVNGHEYTPENTATRPNGTRRCRECSRSTERRKYLRKKARASLAPIKPTPGAPVLIGVQHLTDRTRP